jgi:hypothetical protein
MLPHSLGVLSQLHALDLACVPMRGGIRSSTFRESTFRESLEGWLQVDNVPMVVLECSCARADFLLNPSNTREVYDFKGNLVNLIDEYDAQIEIKIIRRWSEDEQSQYHSLHLRSELEKTVNGEAQIKPLANYLKSTKPTVSFRKSSEKNQSKAEEPIKSDAFQKFGNNLKQQK